MYEITQCCFFKMKQSLLLVGFLHLSFPPFHLSIFLNFK